MEKFFGVLFLIIAALYGVQKACDAFWAYDARHNHVSAPRNVRPLTAEEQVVAQCGREPQRVFADSETERAQPTRGDYDDYVVTVRAGLGQLPIAGVLNTFLWSRGERNRDGERSFGPQPEFAFLPDDAAASEADRAFQRWMDCEVRHGRRPPVRFMVHVPRNATLGFMLRLDVKNADGRLQTLRVGPNADHACVADAEVTARRIGSRAGDVTLNRLSFAIAGALEQACILHVADSPLPCATGTHPRGGSCQPDQRPTRR
jgi:hypothetical protein